MIHHLIGQLAGPLTHFGLGFAFTAAMWAVFAFIGEFASHVGEMNR